MKQINDWENIKEATEFPKLTEGGYIGIVKIVEDDSGKEYLKIGYDIAEGEYKDYYTKLYNSQNFWGGTFYRSYKESASAFFKGFITAIERSNPAYKWNWNEQTLKGKLIGLVLGLEEYIPTMGEHAGKVKERLYVAQVRTVDEIRTGNYKIPEKKVLVKINSNTVTTSTKNVPEFDINEDDLQF